MKKSKTENQASSYKRNLLTATKLKAHFGNKRNSDIESNEILIRRYINRRKEEIKAKQMRRGRTEAEVAYTAINRELALLRTMFNVRIKAGKATKNPVSLVTFFEEVQRERVLNYEEETKIFETPDKLDKRYAHLGDMIAIAFNTGMRQGEILAMEQGWINLKESVIIVPRKAQKRKKRDKRVPINSAIRPIIERLLRENRGSEYLFANPKTGSRFYSIQNSWNGVFKEAGLEGEPGVDKLRFHDLRHTAATNLGRSGKDINFIARYFGHSDVRTWARYIHYSDEDLKEGAEILAQLPSIFTAPKTGVVKALRAHSSNG